MLIVVLFVLINTIITLLPAGRPDLHVGGSGAVAGGLGYNSTSKWPPYGYTARYISIEVLSSKDRVRICVDDATVMMRYFDSLCSLVTLLNIFESY